MKRIILGADLLSQNKDVHLQDISKDNWSNYMKMESQGQRLPESMNLVRLPSIARLSKRKRQAYRSQKHLQDSIHTLDVFTFS